MVAKCGTHFGLSGTVSCNKKIEARGVREDVSFASIEWCGWWCGDHAGVVQGRAELVGLLTEVIECLGREGGYDSLGET